jgi:hypothetical protein
VDPLGFRVFTDGVGHLTESAHCAKEPAIRFRRPADVAGSAPSIGTQFVETAVVTNSIRRIAFDLVTAEVTQPGPRIDIAWPFGDNRCNRCASTTRIDAKRMLQGLTGLTRRFRDHSRRRAGCEQLDGSIVAHCATVRPPALYGCLMTAMSYTTAKDIAVVAVVVLIALAVLMAKLMAGISKKLLAIMMFAALAFGVWSQRQALQSCAATAQATGKTVPCRFFGTDITVGKSSTG